VTEASTGATAANLLGQTWEPTTYRGISLRGHTHEGQTIIDKLRQFKTGAQSLLRREVPVLASAGIPDD
jgi:hypothetical protein